MSSFSKELSEIRPPDAIVFLEEYEQGELNEEAIIAGFQELIDLGLVWHLQGSYGRTAMSFIRQGLCRPPKDLHEGN
jgi:hypothetical protein